MNKFDIIISDSGTSELEGFYFHDGKDEKPWYNTVSNHIFEDSELEKWVILQEHSGSALVYVSTDKPITPDLCAGWDVPESYSGLTNEAHLPAPTLTSVAFDLPDMEVEGAGSDIVNGTYFRAYNGSLGWHYVQEYNATSTKTIFYDTVNSRWVIQAWEAGEGDGVYYKYTSSGEAALTPDLVETWNVDSSASALAPAPTVNTVGNSYPNLFVEGGGATDANGRYILSKHDGTNPEYTKAVDDETIKYNTTDTAWEIASSGSTIYYTSSGSELVETPDLVEEWTESGESYAPAPNVFPYTPKKRRPVHFVCKKTGRSRPNNIKTLRGLK